LRRLLIALALVVAAAVAADRHLDARIEALKAENAALEQSLLELEAMESSATPAPQLKAELEELLARARDMQAEAHAQGWFPELLRLMPEAARLREVEELEGGRVRVEAAGEPADLDALEAALRASPWFVDVDADRRAGLALTARVTPPPISDDQRPPP